MFSDDDGTSQSPALGDAAHVLVGLQRQTAGAVASVLGTPQLAPSEDEDDFRDAVFEEAASHCQIPSAAVMHQINGKRRGNIPRLLTPGAGDMYTPQAQSIARARAMFGVEEKRGAIAAGVQGSGKTTRLFVGLYATTDFPPDQIPPAAIIVPSGQIMDDTYRNLKDTWLPKTVEIVLVKDPRHLVAHPPAKHARRRLYVIGHGKSKGGVDINSKVCKEAGVWDVLAGVFHCICIDEARSALVRKHTQNMLVECVDTIRGPDTRILKIDASLTKYLRDIHQLRKIVKMIDSKNAAVDTYTLEQLSGYIIYHTEETYDAAGMFPREEFKQRFLPCSYDAPREEYLEHLSEQMARCILEEDLPAVVIAGSTENELCPYLSELEKEVIREILTERHNIRCFGLRSDGTVAEAVQNFLACGEKKVFMMFETTTEGMDAFKDVKHMFMIGRNGMLRDREGPSKGAKKRYEEWMCAVADETSTRRRIRRAGSTKMPVTYWTFTGAERTAGSPASSASSVSTASPAPSPAAALDTTIVPPPPPTGRVAAASKHGAKRRKPKSKQLTRRKTKTASKAGVSGGGAAAAAGGRQKGGAAARRKSKRSRGAVERPTGQASKRARTDKILIWVSKGLVKRTMVGNSNLTFDKLVEDIEGLFQMEGAAACTLSYKDEGYSIEIVSEKVWEACKFSRTDDRIRLNVRFDGMDETSDEEDGY
eukprot:gene5074-5837_t